MSSGKKFRQALKDNKPLQVVGTVNAYCAMMAERVGHQAIYLSGGGVANASYGLPDLGMTSMNDVLEDVRRITSASSLPLLVDIDTGWGGAFNISRTIKEMEKAGAAAVHIEDQVAQKRCGHRPNKEIVSLEEMVDRVKAAADARIDQEFFIMARTDAFAQQGLEAAIERAQACVAAAHFRVHHCFEDATEPGDGLGAGLAIGGAHPCALGIRETVFKRDACFG